LGFADRRNQQLEEERSPEGLEEVEKELSHSKKPLQKQKKQEEDFCSSCGAVETVRRASTNGSAAIC
jgi:hypothetical protein